MDLSDLSQAQFVPPVARRPWMDDQGQAGVWAGSVPRQMCGRSREDGGSWGSGSNGKLWASIKRQ